MAERNVLLKSLKHPFLVGLHYSFQTPEKLYFVLDYVNGGEVILCSALLSAQVSHPSSSSTHPLTPVCLCLSSCSYSSICRESDVSRSPGRGSTLLRWLVPLVICTPSTLCTGQSCCFSLYSPLRDLVPKAFLL